MKSKYIDWDKSVRLSALNITENVLDWVWLLSLMQGIRFECGLIDLSEHWLGKTEVQMFDKLVKLGYANLWQQS